MFINPSVPDIMKTLATQLAAKGLEAKDIDKIGTVGRGGEGKLQQILGLKSVENPSMS